MPTFKNVTHLILQIVLYAHKITPTPNMHVGFTIWDGISVGLVVNIEFEVHARISCCSDGCQKSLDTSPMFLKQFWYYEQHSNKCPTGSCWAANDYSTVSLANPNLKYICSFHSTFESLQVNLRICGVFLAWAECEPAKWTSFPSFITCF